MPPKNRYDIAQRAQAITLLVIGSPYDYITAQTGISKRQVQYYLATAKSRGYNPEVSIILKEEYLQDGIRPGRPRKTSPEQEEALIESIKRDRYAREKTSAEFGYECNISASTVQRIFKRNNIRKLKPI
jgi:transposase